MSVIATLSELIDEPQRFIDRSDIRETGRAGLTGYLFGALSLFIFLRLFSSVPPGAYSFLSVLSAVLLVNFAVASSMHLFLEMTGSGGSALRLFFLLGATELMWAVLIPLGFLAKLGFLTPAADFLICLVAVLTARISLMRRLYSISRNKAFLALGMPCAALTAAFLIFCVYAIVYLVWLIG
jgi:hypothetical protein